MEYSGTSHNKALLYTKLSDRINEYIKEEKLQPGDRLPGERKLAAEWKVSRPSLREAIRELENQGVVQVAVGKGTFVTDYVEGRQISINLALRNFLELFEIKTVLERYSLEKAIPKISEEKMKELEDLAVQMDAIAATGNMPKEMDHNFHATLLAGYGNTEMTNLVKNMIKMYETFDEELYGHFEARGIDYNSFFLATFPLHLEMVHKMQERDVAGALEYYDKIVEMDLKLYRQIEQ